MLSSIKHVICGVKTTSELMIGLETQPFCLLPATVVMEGRLERCVQVLHSVSPPPGAAKCYTMEHTDPPGPRGKWVGQPIHWSINSGLFYQYIWLIYKCIMLKQNETKQIEIINDTIHDFFFFFSFTFIQVPCRVGHGSWTWNVNAGTLRL